MEKFNCNCKRIFLGYVTVIYLTVSETLKCYDQFLMKFSHEMMMDKGRPDEMVIFWIPEETGALIIKQPTMLRNFALLLPNHMFFNVVTAMLNENVCICI